MGPRGWRFYDLNLWGSVCSIVGFVATGWGFLRSLFEASPGLLLPAGPTRLYTILFLGLMAAVCHGVLWSLVERVLSWSFGAGGGDSLPQGWAAAILSATMTIPLVMVPALYQRVSHNHVLLPRHFVAAIVIIVLAAFAHLWLYGAKAISFTGIRNIVFPLGSPPNLGRAILMESIYSVTHFTSIVLPYRIVVGSALNPLDASVLSSTALSALVFFFGVNIFILLRYPDSLVDKTWIQVRGIIAGLLLMVALQGGMLM